MGLSNSIKNLKTDKRLYSLNLKMGEINPQQHSAYLQTLEDVAPKSKKLSVEGEQHTEAEASDDTTDMN